MEPCFQDIQRIECHGALTYVDPPAWHWKRANGEGDSQGLQAHDYIGMTHYPNNYSCHEVVKLHEHESYIRVLDISCYLRGSYKPNNLPT